MNELSDLTVEFSTEKFDYKSELSDEFNAGNRLYGKDVAEFLCNQLEARGIFGDLLDEDWGWLVLAHENSDPMIEICVYHWVESDSAQQNTWRLRVSSFVKERALLLFKRRRAVPNSASLVAALKAMFQGDEFQVTKFGTSDDW